MTDLKRKERGWLAGERPFKCELEGLSEKEGQVLDLLVDLPDPTLGALVDAIAIIRYVRKRGTFAPKHLRKSLSWLPAGDGGGQPDDSAAMAASIEARKHSRPDPKSPMSVWEAGRRELVERRT